MEKTSNIKLGQNGLLVYNTFDYDAHFTNQHLYVLSDEEIKEGEMCVLDWEGNFSTNDIRIGRKEGNGVRNQYKNLSVPNERYPDHKWYKVIATTNFLIVEDFKINKKLPQIPQLFINYFIEEYNKSNVITDVMIEYEQEICLNCEWGYDSCPNMQECLNICKIKINPNNTINIKPIKNSWDREEIFKIWLGSKNLYLREETQQIKKERELFNDWIEENL